MYNIPKLEKGLPNTFDTDEVMLRAQITQYIGWVFQHTIPILSIPPSHPTRAIVDVDVNAIIELAEHFAFYLEKQGRSKEILPLFSHFEAFVPLPGLNEGMLALKTAWLWFKFDKPQEVQDLLESISNILEVRHPPLLEIYLDFFSDIPVTRQLQIVDRILGLRANAHFLKHGIVLHYSCTKAVFTLMLGAEDDAVTILDEAIESYLPSVAQKEDFYSLSVCSETHELRWRLKTDDNDLHKAIKYLDKALCYTDLTTRGLSRYYFRLGMLYLDAGSYNEAICHLKKSIQREEYQPSRIHLAEAYIRADMIEKGGCVCLR